MSPLKAYREKNNLSQEELAALLEISRQMVGMLENSERKCTAEMALLIEKKIGIDRLIMRPDIFRKRAA